MEGVDYHHTYAPVAHIESIMLMLSLAVHYKWFIHQMDIDNAYLNAELKEDIYMTLPTQFRGTSEEGRVVKLKKSLYGLKQAGNEWYGLLCESLSGIGWTSCKKEYCIFVRTKDQLCEYILLYVDDLLIFSPSEERMLKIKKEIIALFPAKDLGPVKHFLGMALTYDHESGSIAISQKSLIKSMYDQYKNQLPIKIRNTPADDGIYNIHEDDAPCDKTVYQSCIGALLYIARFTRPDLLSTISILGRYAAQPKVKHLEYLGGALGYLHHTQDLRLTLKRTKNRDITAYSDADYGSDRVTRRSMSGYVVRMGENAISWKCKKQSLVATSTMESELVALAETTKEILWTKHILEELKVENETVPLVYCDNQAAMQVASHPTNHDKSKHIDIKNLFMRDYVERGDIKIQYVSTNSNLADLFTKPVKKSKLQVTREKLNVIGDRGSVKI